MHIKGLMGWSRECLKLLFKIQNYNFRITTCNALSIKQLTYIFRRFFKDMPQVALDKKSNFELLERESGLKRFLPKSVIDSMRVS